MAFSRCLYAQLAMQAFQAPRGWPMPLPSESEFAAAQLGAKVAAGFEMLLAKAPAPDQGAFTRDHGPPNVYQSTLQR